MKLQTNKTVLIFVPATLAVFCLKIIHPVQQCMYLLLASQVIINWSLQVRATTPKFWIRPPSTLSNISLSRLYLRLPLRNLDTLYTSSRGSELVWNVFNFSTILLKFDRVPKCANPSTAAGNCATTASDHRDRKWIRQL